MAQCWQCRQTAGKTCRYSADGLPVLAVLVVPSTDALPMLDVYWVVPSTDALPILDASGGPSLLPTPADASTGPFDIPTTGPAHLPALCQQWQVSAKLLAQQSASTSVLTGLILTREEILLFHLLNYIHIVYYILFLHSV